MIKKGVVASFLLQKVLFSGGSCVPKPQRLRRFVISPLSARLCLFLLSLSSFSKDLSEILRRRARSTAENHAALPAFAVLTVFSVFFVPDRKKPNVSCETFGFFLLSSSFFGFLLSFVSPFVFRFSLPYCSARCFFLLFTLFLGRFFTFALLGRFLGVFS